MTKPMAIKKERPLTGSFTDYLVSEPEYKDKHEIDLTSQDEPVYDSDEDWYVPLDEDMQIDPRPYK